MCHYNVSTEITSKWGDWGVWGVKGGYMKSPHFDVIWQEIMDENQVFFHTPVCHYNDSTEITSKWGDWGVWGGYMESAHFEVIWQGNMNIVHVFFIHLWVIIMLVQKSPQSEVIEVFEVVLWNHLILRWFDKEAETTQTLCSVSFTHHSSHDDGFISFMRGCCLQLSTDNGDTLQSA